MISFDIDIKFHFNRLTSPAYRDSSGKTPTIPRAGN
jgi:hypothetical protein